MGRRWGLLESTNLAGFDSKGDFPVLPLPWHSHPLQRFSLTFPFSAIDPNRSEPPDPSHNPHLWTNGISDGVPFFIGDQVVEGKGIK